MNSYETLATVEREGAIHISGAPFAPGTEVEVTINLKRRAGDSSSEQRGEDLEAMRSKMRNLFASVKGFQMTPKFRREELYDRRSSH